MGVNLARIVGDAAAAAREGVADSRDNLIPLSFLDSRMVDRYEIQVAAREIASVVPVFVLAKARHYEEPSCRTRMLIQFRSWIK